METSNWRAHLQAGSRERAVNRIMDGLKSHIQVYRDEMHHELEKIAVRFEEDVYITATTQSDYMRKICFKILTIETTPHNIVYPSDPASLYSTNGEDWQEQVYEKIKAMKDLYLPDLNYMHQKIVCKLQQIKAMKDLYLPILNVMHQKFLGKLQQIKAMKDLYLLDLNDMHQKILGKLQQQSNKDQIEKLKVFKNMLEHFMVFLQIPKHNIMPHHKDKLATYEKQIVHVITSNRRHICNDNRDIPN